MVFSTIEDIKDCINNPKNSNTVDRALEIHKDHIRHIYGKGVDEFITKIEGFESEAQKKVRLKYVGTPTVPIYGRVLMNMEKIFSAQGGTTYYEFDKFNEDREKKFAELISDVGEKMSLRDWMQIVWKDKVNTDPGGLNFIEVDETGEFAYLTYKSINDILDYNFTGVCCEYVIFQPYLKKDADGQPVRHYRVVDDQYDYLFKQVNKNLILIEEETYPNYFGRTPAILFSNQIDSLSRAKTTYVCKSITLADDYLTDASIHKLYKKKHGFPVFAMRGVRCANCSGTGHIDNGDECRICQGTGTTLKKDISDILEVPPLETQDQPDPMNPVAVYVHAPTEISKEQREILDDLETDIHDAVWGKSQVNRKGNTTATGELLDVSHSIDKLEDISTNAEIVERELLDLFGDFYFPENYKTAIINYGRRYILKKDNQIWEEYTNAKEKGAPEIELNMLYEEYLRSKYQKDMLSLNWALKLMQVEPNFHRTLKELKELGADRKEIAMKQYFNDFINWFEIEGKSIRDTSVKDLKEELKKYIETLNIVELNTM